MATREEAEAFFNDMAGYVDENLRRGGPDFTFSLVFWFKGDAENVNKMAIMTPPEGRAEQRAALLRASSISETPNLELHGLDTSNRVCFYEQDYYVLSNFSAFAIELFNDGSIFPTVEHAYHWRKFFRMEERMTPQTVNLLHMIAGATSAHEAFKLAQEHKHLRRPDWDDIKDDVMLELLRAKVDQHEYVRRKLLATGDRLLVENSWRDDYWGWGQNRDGKNMLGRLWMQVRSELRQAEQA